MKFQMGLAEGIEPSLTAYETVGLPLTYASLKWRRVDESNAQVLPCPGVQTPLPTI